MKKILLFICTLCFQTIQIYALISWQEPTAISNTLVDASEPRIVIDPSGNATAIWIENGIINSASLPFGGSWSPPVTISNVLNTASNPKLGVDSNGNVTALWIENTQIKTTTKPFEGGWNASISTISSSGASTPVLAVDINNNAVALWVRNNLIESTTRLSGVWSTATTISASNSNNPHVSVNNMGQAAATWHRTVSGTDTIVTNILTISTNTWGTSKNVFAAVAAIRHNYPKIAIDDGGNCTVAWFRYNFVNSIAYQNAQVLVSTLTSGAAAWSIPTILSNSGLRNPADLTIKLRTDSTGNILVVWNNSYDGENFVIESACKMFGGSWPLFATPQVPSRYSFWFDLAASSGTVLLTNMALDGDSTLEIQSQEADTANPLLQAWSVITPFSSGDKNGYPQCALCTIDSTFYAAAVWTHFDGQNTLIHSSFGSGPAIAPPSNVAVVQSSSDFGIFREYYNTISWSASSQPDLSLYFIYRNGIYFASTLPNKLEVVDHNAVQGEVVTYGVAVFTSSYRLSELATFTLTP